MKLSTVAVLGVALGVAYTLSPLAVLCLASLAALVRWAASDLQGRERDWFLIVFVTAIVTRVVIIGGLLLIADDTKPYAVLFGDEWIFKSRPIWLRNVGLGIPISTADFIYAYDETGMSGHMYVLGLLQALVGDAPYGMHLFSVTIYCGAMIAMYRVVRSSFGAGIALGGTAVLLFLPSLFFWSISVLKEPVYIAVAMLELLMVLAIVRGQGWARRAAAVVAVIVLAFTMEELRRGTVLVAALGAGVGLATWWILQAYWRVAAALILVPSAIVVAFMQEPVQARALNLVHQSVKLHAGHIVTAGVSYPLVEPRIYQNWALIPQIDGREGARYVARAVLAYFVEPLPDKMQSRLLWSYLPEHFTWLLLMVLAPIGVAGAMRRDPALASLLLAHAASIVMMVALASGNIGTLVRHRGLSLPYLVWFSVLGAAMVMSRLQAAGTSRAHLESAGE